MNELALHGGKIGLRIGGVLGLIVGGLLGLIGGPLAVITAGIGAWVGAFWGFVVGLLVGCSVGAVPRLGSSEAVAALYGAAVGGALTWVVGTRFGLSVAAIGAVLGGVAGALGGLLLVTGLAPEQPAPRPIDAGPGVEATRLDAAPRHADLPGPLLPGPLLPGERVYRDIATVVIAGVAAAGGVLGGIRGWSHLPTFPVAIVEGGLLGGAAGVGLSVPVLLGIGLGRTICGRRPHSHVR